MNMRKKLLLCLAAGFVLTILSARVAGSSLVLKIMPITLPQQSSEINGNDVISACPSSLMAVEEYGFPLLVYEHIEESDGCGAVFSSPARIFPVAIVLDVLFWTAAVFAGTVLVARLQNRSRTAGEPASRKLPQTPQRVGTLVTPQTKLNSLVALCVISGGVIGFAFCMSLVILCAYIMSLRHLIIPVLGWVGAVQGIAQHPATWVTVATAAALVLPWWLHRRIKATSPVLAKTTRTAVILPFAVSLGLIVFVVMMGLNSSQASQTDGWNALGVWVLGSILIIFTYIVWLIVMLVWLIKQLTRKNGIRNHSGV